MAITFQQNIDAEQRQLNVSAKTRLLQISERTANTDLARLKRRAIGKKWSQLSKNPPPLPKVIEYNGPPSLRAQKL